MATPRREREPIGLQRCMLSRMSARQASQGPEGLLGEDALILEARRGDVAAFEELVRRHQDMAFRTAYLIVGSAAESEDVVQEAFVRAYRALPSFKVGRPLRPWLLRIVANQAHNAVKALRRRSAVAQRYAQASLDCEPDDPAVVASLDERSRRLWTAIHRLREEEQTVIYLRFFLALPERELAAFLNVRPGTVKSRLHRASRRLRDVIVREFPELAEEMGA